jgi:hypothetical protein
MNMPRLFIFATVLGVLVLLTLLASNGTHRREDGVEYPWGYYEKINNTKITAQWILRNDTFGETLRHRVATKDGAVIFTTLRLGVKVDPKEVLAHASNWCYWLDKLGLLNNAMLITTDERTWEVLHARGLPGGLLV